MAKKCVHIWTAAENSDGSIAYRVNQKMWIGVRVHVTCSECNDRTWMTKEQWESLPDNPTDW